MNPPKQALAAALISLGVHGAAHAAAPEARLDFSPCADAASHAALAGSLCAVARVPGDPSGLSGAPAKGQAAEMSLFLRKYPATGKSRGQVWLVAGGPSESGASLYGQLATVRKAFPGFDLVIPDHRGTGFSTRMCPEEEAPTSAGGTALEGAEWGSCFARLSEQPAYARQFSVTNAAHDLKLLLERTPRQGQTWLYGVSYGTQLVLRTLAVGAPKVDGIVLDSLVPLQDDATADLSRRSLVVDAAGRGWLARCDADPHCSAGLGEPAEQTYRRMLARLDADPALREAIPGKDARRFFGSMLDVPTAVETLPHAIRDLAEGKPNALSYPQRAMAHASEQLPAFPQSPISIPLVAMISGSENNLRPERTKAEVKAEEKDLLFTSPLPGMLVAPGVPMYPRDKYFNVLPKYLPRTLVIQSALDPKTPYDAALRHVAALRRAGSVSVTRVESGAHFVLWSMPGCFERAVGAFVAGKEPEPVCDLRKVLVMSD